MSTAQATAQAFGALISSAAEDGKIDARTKELIIYALVVLARCEPCMNIHLPKAKNMGISQEELDEAAWLAIAMGGSPIKMFYIDYLQKAEKKETDN